MGQRSLYLFAFSFLLFIVSAIIRYQSFNTLKEYTKSVDLTRETITSLEKLSSYFKSAQIYSPRLEHSVAPGFYGLYRHEAGKINSELDRLDDLVKGDPYEEKLKDSISRMIERHLGVLLEYNIAELIAIGDHWRLSELFRINSALNTLVDYEERNLESRNRELNKSIYFNNIISLVLVVIAAAIIITTFLNNLGLNRKQKWLEGFLESVLNTSQSGTVSYHALREKGQVTDFKIEYANKATERLLDISLGDMIGKKLSEMPSHMRNVDLFEVYKKALETDERSEVEVFYKKDDLQRWFTILLAHRGNGLTATFHDISAIKKYQKDLEVTVQNLAKSNKELEQYAYAASHDLQEPLRKVQIFGNYLWERQADKLDEKSRQYLEKILESAARMNNLIKDLLTFSSLGKEADFIPTDLNEALNYVLQDLELLIAQKEAQVQKDDLPLIEAIPLQMQQLFYNLLNNALKFTRSDIKPFIRVTARTLTATEVQQHTELQQDLEYCEIVVADNGIGFSNTYAKQIFGLFKRLNSKEQFGGSGIGLSLCQRVVENHNGIIYASGEEGKGAQFCLILPLRQPHAS